MMSYFQITNLNRTINQRIYLYLDNAGEKPKSFFLVSVEFAHGKNIEKRWNSNPAILLNSSCIRSCLGAVHKL